MNSLKAQDFIRCKVLLSKLNEWRYMNDSEKKELASLLNYFWVHPFNEEEKKQMMDEHWIDVNDEVEKILEKYWK
jgi:acyl-homoserine lactone acylase PvdQ